MHKVIIIGDKQTSLPFLGTGVDVITIEDTEEMKRKLAELFKKESYGIIMVTQSLAGKSLDFIEKLSESKTFPLITIVPDATGEVSEISKQRLRNLIKKAVGMELPE